MLQERLVKIYEPGRRYDDKLPAMLWIHGGGYVLGHPDMDDELYERFVQTARCVVVENHSSGISPYAVPTIAENLAGLPPTYTYVGQLDLFRDETIEYVTRLAQAGVNVEFHLYPGCFHLFEFFVPEAEVSQRAAQSYMEAMARALHFP